MQCRAFVVNDAEKRLNFPDSRQKRPRFADLHYDSSVQDSGALKNKSIPKIIAYSLRGSQLDKQKIRLETAI